MAQVMFEGEECGLSFHMGYLSLPLIRVSVGFGKQAGSEFISLIGVW